MTPPCEILDVRRGSMDPDAPRIFSKQLLQLWEFGVLAIQAGAWLGW